jgi:hypothetical protein
MRERATKKIFEIFSRNDFPSALPLRPLRSHLETHRELLRESHFSAALRAAHQKKPVFFE